MLQQAKERKRHERAECHMSDRYNNFADDSAAAHDDEDDDDDVDVDVDLFPQCVGKGTGECS